MKLFKDKYRIIEIDNIFYPQIRVCYIWCEMYDFRNTSFWDAEKYKFTTLEEATNFIDSKIKELCTPKPKKIIHKYKN